MSGVSPRDRRRHARRPGGGTARAIAALATVAGCLAASASPAAAQSDPCPNAEYRVGLSAHLPDCRAYEKVSPAYKGNGEIAGGLTLPSAFRATPDGHRILYPADSVFLGAPAFPQINGYFADRGGAGWTSRSVSALLPFNVNPSVLPTGMVNTDTQPFGLSADGRKTVAITDRDPVTGGTIPKQPYLIDLVSGDVERMAPDVVAGDPSVPLSNGGANIGFGIAGDDTFANVYYSSLAQLTPDSVAPGISAADAKLYRYADGESLLASYLPDGTPTKGIMVDSANDPVGSNSVSADGQVYWFTQGSDAPDRRLFRGVAGVQGSTLVSASEATSPGPADDATFGGASADGERVVFRSAHALLDGVGTGGAYLYTHSADPENDSNLTLLSVDSEPADGIANAVGMILGVSDDAGVVYFTTAGNQLVAGGPVGPTPKIYRWEDGEVTFVATASVTVPGMITRAMSTPDGRYLMFMSNTAGVTAAPTAGTAQQYRYDSADGSVVCTSCRTDGSASTTSARLDQFVSFMRIDRKKRRWLSDDGRVFFETAEPLESRDTNGAVDVYTYADAAEGPRLISDGRTTSDARFADASSDGATVFFATRGQLTGWDTDERQDLYAARVGGGLPAPNDRPGGACSGDACQGQPAGGPAVADPRSAELESRGNVATAVLSGPRVARTRVRGAAGWLRVRVPARGRLTVRGPLLRRSARRVERPGAHRIRVRLSPRGRRALVRRGRLGVRITVRFAPGAGPARVARTRLTFRANRAAERRSRARGASGEAR